MTLDMTSCYSGGTHSYREEELARLVFILVTPEPPTGVSSTSNGSTCHAIYETIAKDALLVLAGIVQSSDAFPPLKSAASGLLFFATCADVSIRIVAGQTRIGSFLTRQLPATRSRSATYTGALTPLRHLSGVGRETETCAHQSIKRPL